MNTVQLRIILLFCHLVATANMPYKCCVFGCNSNYDNTTETIPIFRFPRDEKLKKKWLQALQNIVNYTENIRICRKHWPEV